MTMERIPIDLPPERITAIIKTTVQEELEAMWSRLEEVEGFPGLEKLTPREKLAVYIKGTQPADLLFLSDEYQYITKHILGVAPPLVSPFWQNLLQLPRLFEKSRREFMQLYASQAEKVGQ